MRQSLKRAAVFSVTGTAILWIALGLCLIVLFCGEIAARFYYDWRAGDSTVGIIPMQRFAPYYMYAHSGFNSDGFCARELETYRDTGDTIKIVLLGGSVASSYGGPGYNGEWFYEKLEKKLNRAGLSRPVLVINMAVGGYISRQEHLVLLSFGRKLRPDLVITFDGNNDVEHVLVNGDRPGYPGNYVEMERWFRYAHGLKGAFRALRRQSMLAFFLDNQFKKLGLNRVFSGEQASSTIASVKGSQNTEEEIVNIYAETLELITSYCRRIGARHLAVLQPCALIDKRLTPEETRRQIPPSNTSSAFIDTYRRCAESLAHSARAGSIDRFLDLTSCFDGIEESLYSDICHFNINQEGYNRAYDLMADRIVQYIVDEKLTLRSS